MTFLPIVGISVVLYASTNIDDLFILLGFFADQKFSRADVIVGQYAGIAILFFSSVLASLLSILVPRTYLGLLGFVPMLVGALRLIALYRKRGSTEQALEHHTAAGSIGRTATVALVTIANGGDNLGVYIPAFAIRSHADLLVIGLVFAALTGLWCALAHWLTHHPALRAPILRYGHRVTPFVLIALGVLILHEAGSAALIWHAAR